MNPPVEVEDRPGQNYAALESASSPYAFCPPERDYNGRIIRKYILQPEKEDASEKAVEAILLFLHDNRHFFPTFLIEPEDVFRNNIAENVYLTLNGHSISLAKERESSQSAPMEYIDRFFSQTFLREPVVCASGQHYLESSRAKIWSEYTDNCPGGSHPIGDLIVDNELLERIEGYCREQEPIFEFCKNYGYVKKKYRINGIESFQAQMEIQRREREKQIQRQKSLQAFKEIIGSGSEAGIKILRKCGGKTICLGISKHLQKSSVKKLVKALGKSIAKKIPVVSFVIGFFLAVYRLTQGQLGRAAGEFVSGACATIPGWGTVFSMAIDFGMGVYDVKEAVDKSIQPSNVQAQIELDLPRAYKLLGIESNNPSQKEVKDAFRSSMSVFHPDRVGDLGEYNQKQLLQFSQLLAAARHSIYNNKVGVSFKNKRTRFKT